ncbi:hypothetical protein [Candidatus Pseudoscillospira sp. SGI.172]|uniref:hypothetical protein n=1 Tax=Candidatus Pseudoscillospira sp. SGI.172 TaxID=3420582 RepID=UPI0009BA12AA|nr:toxin-antitoxin system toxin subunit [Pseudoflavonifractor sp.]MDY3019791.1 toxin-antitoxin system toxin subunit [Oscillospiraceae bacterium]
MLTIIELTPRADGGHGVQSQSHRKECWLEGWIEVPEALVQTVWDCGGYCELTVEEGVLTAVTPAQRPAGPEQEPTELEQLRADVDYLAAMGGVDL